MVLLYPPQKKVQKITETLPVITITSEVLITQTPLAITSTSTIIETVTDVATVIETSIEVSYLFLNLNERKIP